MLQIIPHRLVELARLLPLTAGLMAAFGLPQTTVLAQPNPPAAATTDPEDTPLPKLSELPLPTAETLLTKPPVDWIVLLKDEVLVVQPVFPRPGTLEKLAAKKKELSSAATRPKKEPGESDEDYRARMALELAEAENLSVILPDNPDTPDKNDPREYKLPIGRNVQRIIHHEDLMLRRVDQLLNDGQLTKAFEMLLIVERSFAEWPGLAERRNRLIFEEASLRQKNGRMEEALAYFEELAAVSPQYNGLKAGIGAAVDKLVGDAFANEDIRQARFFLLRLKKVDEQHPVFAKWVEQFIARSGELLKQASEAREKGQHPEALTFVERAARIWPDHASLRNLHNATARRWQVLNVGVIRLPGDPAPWPFKSAEDRRHEDLLATPLFDVQRFERAAFYESRYFEEWTPTDLGRQIVFSLRPRRSTWETNPVLTATDVVYSLNDRLNRESPWFDERLATSIKSMQVRSPQEFVIQFESIPVRPQSLFRFPVRQPSQGAPSDSASTDGLLSQRFRLHEKTDARVSFRRSIPQNDGLSQYRIAEIVERKYPNHEATLQGLARGEVSILPSLPLPLLPNVEGDEKYYIVNYGVPATHVIQFNTASKPLKNGELRRALATALDRERMLKDIVLKDPTMKRGRLVSAPFPSSSYAYRSQTPLRAKDLPLAYALLSVAKKSMSGTIPELTMICEPDVTSRAVAQEVVAQWGRLGIKVNLIDDPAEPAPENWDILYRTVRMSEPATDLWPFLTLREDTRVEDLEPLPDWLRQSLIELEQAVDFNTSVEMLQRLHDRLDQLVHLIPLWEVDDVIVIRRSIQGFPQGMVTPYQNVERWISQPFLPEIID